MPKYINADALIAQLDENCETTYQGDSWYGKEPLLFKDEVIQYISQFPPADVRENIHGEWVPSDLDENFKVCSVCKNKGYKDRMAWRQDYIKAYLKFCPNCGADNRPNKRARI